MYTYRISCYVDGDGRTKDNHASTPLRMVGKVSLLDWRFRIFSFYPTIAPTGLVHAEDSLETETQFKEKKKVERP